MHNDKFAKGSESQRLISPAIQIPAAIKEKSTCIKVTNLLNWVRCNFQRGEFLNAFWGHSKTKTMSFCIPVQFLKSWMKWFTFSSLKLGGLESRCHHQQGVTVLCSTWFFSHIVGHFPRSENKEGWGARHLRSWQIIWKSPPSEYITLSRPFVLCRSYSCCNCSRRHPSKICKPIALLCSSKTLFIRTVD